jgi:two-component system response regulator WspF
MRIAIVNDMAMALEGLRRVVLSTGVHEIAWTAMCGKEAIEHCASDLPDLILMDIIMPEMNGVETTRLIMQLTPCPILIVTSSVNKNSALVFEAMGNGALDAVNTPVLMGSHTDGDQESLLRKISMLNVLTQPRTRDDRGVSLSTVEKNCHKQDLSLVAIGASSGGPQALATVLRNLPTNFSSAIVIVQHVDMQFSQGLADWLDQQSKLPVRLAKQGDRPTPGQVLLAGSNDHLVLTENGDFCYTADPISVPYRPSVDVFWDSLSKHWRGELTAILLTGMGRDGAKSMLELRHGGARTIAQDQQSCAVFGMPKAAIAINAAKEICSIEEIAEILVRNEGLIQNEHASLNGLGI